jgi:hypothetical protein
VSTINTVFFFFFFSLSAPITFLPEWVIVGVRNFAWGFNSQKNKIWGGKKYFLGLNNFCGSIFRGVKIVGDQKMLGQVQTTQRKEAKASVDWGLSGGSSMQRRRSEDLHRR